MSWLICQWANTVLMGGRCTPVYGFGSMIFKAASISSDWAPWLSSIRPYEGCRSVNSDTKSHRESSYSRLLGIWQEKRHRG